MNQKDKTDIMYIINNSQQANEKQGKMPGIMLPSLPWHSCPESVWTLLKLEIRLNLAFINKRSVLKLQELN